ncbi:carbohydrate-binding module family 21 protein [Backusella circina FSU 941]|nr:carbohydrate-binding module family 21 protein [Backusella circina FSU 941]
MSLTLSSHPIPFKKVQLKRPTTTIMPMHSNVQQKKKTVRFSNEDQVRYFLKCQAPSAIREGDPQENDVSADDFKLTLPNWPKRSIALNEKKIRMENITLTEADTKDRLQNKIMIEGRCKALNISFHKLISVRYTFDLWSTYNETPAVYRDSLATTGNTWDRFSFYIPIEAKKTTLYIALRYSVNNEEYWDNNNGMNYEVCITPEEPEEETEELSEQARDPNDTKVLGRRYDFAASLNAVRKPFSPPPSPPGTPTETFVDYTPPVFFGSLDSAFSKTPSSKSPEFVSPPLTPPMSPPVSAEGFQMSYSDFVDKYCFFNSHNSLYGTYSTSPSAVLS